MSNNPNERFMRPSVKKVNYSCYRALSSSRRSRENSATSREDPSSVRMTSDRGNPELPDFLEFSQIGSRLAGDTPLLESQQLYMENRTVVSGANRNYHHMDRNIGEDDLFRMRKSFKEYSLASSPQVGTNAGPIMLGSLQRSLKKATAEYKPVLRTTRIGPNKLNQPALNFTKIDHILQKYSPKYRLN
jgi:hypothetical protein